MATNLHFLDEEEEKLDDHIEEPDIHDVAYWSQYSVT